jgi:hypothetical protein
MKANFIGGAGRGHPDFGCRQAVHAIGFFALSGRTP